MTVLRGGRLSGQHPIRWRLIRTLRKNVTRLFVMPQKTKAQLRDELEEAKRKLAEAKVKIEKEVAEALRASEEKARESERRLKKEFQTARRECDELG